MAFVHIIRNLRESTSWTKLGLYKHLRNQFSLFETDTREESDGQASGHGEIRGEFLWLVLRQRQEVPVWSVIKLWLLHFLLLSFDLVLFWNYEGFILFRKLVGGLRYSWFIERHLYAQKMTRKHIVSKLKPRRRFLLDPSGFLQRCWWIFTSSRMRREVEKWRVTGVSGEVYCLYSQRINHSRSSKNVGSVNGFSFNLIQISRHEENTRFSTFERPIINNTNILTARSCEGRVTLDLFNAVDFVKSWRNLIFARRILPEGYTLIS